MSRKPPRRRRESEPRPRVPGSKRPRSAPGQGHAASDAPARKLSPGGAGSAHGARAAKPPGSAALRRASAAKRTPLKRARPAPPPAPKAAPRSPAKAAVKPPAKSAARRGKMTPSAPRRTSASRAPKRAGATPRPAGRRARFTPPEPTRVAALLGMLDDLYPDARCALDFGSPLQLLIATILSAQCTDERVNKTTPALFERYPDAAAFAAAPLADLEEMVRSTGFFRMKAKAIQSCCADIVAKHGGAVPRTMDELTALRGVGRKTANVVLGNAYGIPGLVVDTHVTRLSNRLGLTDETDAVRIEFALQPIVPERSWTLFSHWLILHGRRVCVARKPRCSVCPLAPHCPRVGVTASQ
jgi:endonuclease III